MEAPMTRLAPLLLALSLLAGCAGPKDGETPETTTEGVHQGYSETAPEYEVNGFVISNADIRAYLWNPRGKTPEQVAERAAYLTEAYDIKRTEAQQARAAKARETYADAVAINSVMPSSVGVINVTAEQFKKGLIRNRDAGIDLVSCSIYAFPGDGTMPIQERFERSLAVVEELGMVQVRALEDVHRAKREGKLAVMFNCQGADFVIEDMATLEAFHGLGLRVANFVYNANNALAGGGTAQDQGVSELGEAFVRECNRLGIVVDTSHSSNQTAIDAARLSKKPVIASHGCCAALFHLGRNQSDDAIRAVGESGGVVATTGVGLFLNAKGVASPEEFALHVQHTAKLIGRDKTAYSTDYMHNAATFFANNVANYEIYPPEKGFGAPASNLAAEHIWDVVAVLEDEHGWSEAEIRGFLGGNLLRVYEANWR
jgi:microsomal dipeptidase-like Zn-dependent dipeptidase